MVLCVAIACAGGIYCGSKVEVLEYAECIGPANAAKIPSAANTQWTAFERGTESRLAILLTEPDSAWLALAHGLRSMGIPFTVTRDWQRALRHRCVLVYPMITGRLLDAEALKELAVFAREKGTLIGVGVLGGGLNELFGFKEAIESNKRFMVKFNTFDAPEEESVPVGSKANSVGTYGYSEPSAERLADFPDGTAALLSRKFPGGRAYAVGVDLGGLMGVGFNSRAEDFPGKLRNKYQPVIDVWLKWLKSVYRSSEPGRVLVGTVPDGRAVPIMITHDVDYEKSIPNSIEYAKAEAEAGIKATYFVQPKYIRDHNDVAYFGKEAVEAVKKLNEMGMEIASHSISHSKQFAQFPLGSGSENYPDYRPFVRNQYETDGGTLFGELRVSKFLLECLCTSPPVISFRPGELRKPDALAQALVASGYRYCSVSTANHSLTHLPFRINRDRASLIETDMYEFPVTIEDEELPEMDKRFDEANDVTGKIARNGGICVVLIHPNVLDHKLRFMKRFIDAWKGKAWFGTMKDYGSWWAARDRVEIDTKRTGGALSVELDVPVAMTDLTIIVPPGSRFAAAQPAAITVKQEGEKLVLRGQIEGRISLSLAGVAE